MAITFKKVATVAAELPARALNGLSRLFFGYTTADKEEKNGVFTFMLDAIKFGMRALSNAISRHITAISIAFWSSLILASAVALTLFLWPAALAAVASFSIAGVSIAGLVGSGVAAQVGLSAGLTFLATSTATYIGAAIVNGIKALVSLCKGTTDTATPVSENKEKTDLLDDSITTLAALNREDETATATAAATTTEAEAAKKAAEVEQAAHHPSPIQSTDEIQSTDGIFPNPVDHDSSHALAS